jgi:hypothetical protein
MEHQTTFRNLPLTPEQDVEVRAWIAAREQSGEPWDTLALDYMLKDMLHPQDDDEE